MERLWFIANLAEVLVDARRLLARPHALPARRPAAAARPRARGRGLLRALGLDSRCGWATTPPSSSSPASTRWRPHGVPHTYRAGDERRRLPRHLRPGRLRRVPARGRRARCAPRAARSSTARPTSSASPASPPPTASRCSALPACCPSDLARGLRAVGSSPGRGRAGRREREADDVEVVALDARDEHGAGALDGVAAGAALPLAGGDVPVEQWRGSRGGSGPG